MTTLQDLAAVEGDVLKADEVARYLNLAPQQLRAQARSDPAKLGFRVIVCGQRTLIPKAPFIEFMTGICTNSRAQDQATI